MKKLIPLLIALAFVLCSCSDSLSTQSSSKLIDRLELIESATESEPVVLPISYDTVDELIYSISKEYSQDVLETIEQAEKGNNKGTFRSYINKTLSSNYIYVPYYDGREITLRDEEGYSAIDLSPIDMYGLPCIFYHMKHNGNDILIKTVDLNTKLDKDTVLDAADKGVIWLEDQLDEEVHGKEDSFSENVYEEYLQLNNKTVKATYEIQADDPRVHISFIYDDVLVSVWAFPDTITNNWFSGLSFEKKSLVE